ncbi:hypothetical protein GH714_013430 [Hevea brasiliensis]|uniref:Leucine-rich repeat-containing N-terminal plant-type domain-containing protein n=1 Tax=Hevea brasiliensis TaxID=3981 RepID=A0A6A6M036_HEVBR|nr:hypothetical protein GH714_013430 [Hevea brasiliensis]
MEGSFPIQELISDLKNLESLDVSRNKFNSTLPFQDFKSNFSKVSKLKYLDLSENHFDNGILSFSSIFPSVETLDLSFNKLEGPLSYKDLVKLKNLTVLSLRGNNLNGTLPLQKLSKLKNLKSLDVSGNRFNSTLPFQGLCGLKGLQELDLSHNEFGGSLPQCLDNLTSLMSLDLSRNQLTGHIPSSWPANLKFIDLSYNRFEGIFSFKNIPSSSPANFKSSLEYIDLSSNLFEGLFAFNLLANYSSLEVVILSGNNITFETGWIPSFQLKVLIMQSCGLDSIPEFLFYQFKLEALDLSHNKVKKMEDLRS